jgi:trimethylamine--corrinoid protein Co-methyltransferase
MNPTSCALKLQVLSASQLDDLFEATLACLARTGMNVNNAEGRRLLAQAGAQVDGVRVRIPRGIVETTLATTPPTFTLWTRPTDQGPGEPRIELAPYQVYFGPGPTCTYYVDPETGERRKTQRSDPGVTALVCDALPNIDYVMSLGLIDDVTPALAPVYEFAEMAKNTIKPVLPWAYSRSQVEDIYRMAVSIAGSEDKLAREPFLAFFSTFQSPLILADEDTTNALWAADHDLPVVLLGGGTAGMTGPVTGAGLRPGCDPAQKARCPRVPGRSTGSHGSAHGTFCVRRARDESLERRDGGSITNHQGTLYGHSRRVGGQGS